MRTCLLALGLLSTLGVLVACSDDAGDASSPEALPSGNASSSGGVDVADAGGGGRGGGGAGAASSGDPSGGGAGSTPDAGADAKPPKSTMTFFVSSTGSGAAGGNFGGLAGADAKCQALATAVGGGDHTWRAYLSAVPKNGAPQVDARDRIGPGPWRNKQGVEIASSNAALHALGFVLRAADVLDENGMPIADKTKVAIVTGTLRDGTAASGAVSNCENWTTSATNNYGAEYGRADAETLGIAASKWNSAGITQCSEAGMRVISSEGRIYCFAAD